MKKLLCQHIYLCLVLLCIHDVSLLCPNHRTIFYQDILFHQAIVFLLNADYLVLPHFFCLSAETLLLELLHLNQASINLMALFALSYLYGSRNLILLKLAS